jgi:CheY-like chemotaxis protein
MSPHGRILIVDDTPEWRRRLTRILERAGFTVDAAGSTREALERLGSTQYQLAVLDIRMADSDPENVSGMELLHELRRRGSLSPLKIIMLSAYGTVNHMREAFARYGVQDFFDKDSFGTGEEFRKRVEKTFDGGVGSNRGPEL